MLDLIVAVVAMFVAPDVADAVTRTAPAYMTTERAREHVAAAVVSSVAYRTQPWMLMSIAHHESRYDHTAITVEPPSRLGEPRWSCGVCTPEPLTSRVECIEATRSVAAGYLAGARHLRAWLDACRGDLACALRGYGGRAAPAFEWRARWIAREVHRRGSS